MFADHIDYVGMSRFWVPDILQTLRPKYLSWIHLQHSRGIAITFAHWNLNLNEAKILQKIPAGKSDGPMAIGGFHVTSSPPCWWTVNKRLLISSFCLSTSICSFHHCYLCLPRLHENHLFPIFESPIIHSVRQGGK